MPSTLTLKAHAKINLNLKILGFRPDGFHNIDSIMQSISLCDIVTLEEISSGIRLACEDKTVPQGKDNLAYKAAELFIRRLKIAKGINILIEKNIPVAAGLAGGSADAAAVLFGLNEIWKTNLETGELLTLASEVGADVPFCLIGGTARCMGKGEIIEATKPLAKTWMILIKPEIKVSSEWAYETYDLEIGYEEVSREKPQRLYDLELINDLERVVIKYHPEIREVKGWLLKEGIIAALMSGSGPTVVGFASDQKSARNIFDKAKEEYKSVYLAVTVPRGVEVLGAEEWVPEIEV